MPESFTNRINRVLHTSNMRVADLARWLDCPHATVRGWANGGALGLPPQDAEFVLGVLTDIEERCRAREGFPIPKLTWRKRVHYLNALLKADTIRRNRKIPQVRRGTIMDIDSDVAD